MKLRMFSNGYDFVIAYNVEEAKRIAFQYTTGRDAPDQFSKIEQADLEGNGWEECVPDRMFTLHDNGKSITKTVKEWVKTVAFPCWFASTME